MGTCQYEELLNGLTISQGRCHCSKPYTTPYRTVCVNIDSDVVSFHSRAVIDQSRHKPCKMKCSIKNACKISVLHVTILLTIEIALQTTLPNDTQLHLVLEDE